MTERRTGRRPHDAVALARLPKLSDILGGSAPSGDAIDWTLDIPPDDWGMCLNDDLNCCPISGIAHAIDTWGPYVPPPYTPMTDTDVLDAYSASCGYVPGVAKTDRGGRLLDVLTYWVAHPIAGNALLGFVPVDPKNLANVHLAIEIGGGVYTGLLLNQAQIDAAGTQPWAATNQAGDLGHCVWTNSISDASLGSITWGMRQPMLLDFWMQSVEECYMLMPPGLLASGRTPRNIPIQDVLDAARRIAIQAR